MSQKRPRESDAGRRLNRQIAGDKERVDPSRVNPGRTAMASMILVVLAMGCFCDAVWLLLREESARTEAVSGDLTWYHLISPDTNHVAPAVYLDDRVRNTECRVN